jgi:hypothetical protein
LALAPACPLAGVIELGLIDAAHAQMPPHAHGSIGSGMFIRPASGDTALRTE